MRGKINSKRKGKEGEREWAKFCREQGFDVRRTQQYAGGTEESADCVGLPYIHQEVKFGYNGTIEEIRGFLEQAIRDCNQHNLPIIAHRKNYGKWFITMEWQDFVTMYNGATQPYGQDAQEFPDNQLNYVTIPATDWFKLYKEYFAGKEIEKKNGAIKNGA